MIDNVGVLGAGLAAGHGRVDDSQSTFGADLGEFRGDVGPDRGEVDHQGAGLSVGEDPVVTQQDALHLRGVGHHDRDDVGVLDRLLDGFGRLASRFDQRRRCVPATCPSR